MNNKAWVVITTINPLNETSVLDYVKQGNKVVVVGDKKTPHETYINENIEYISDETMECFKNFDKKLPYNHYCRKNLGYLYSIMNGSEIIFDTDDDNSSILTFNR